MYLANPILLMGATGLCLALLLLPWWYGAKTEAMKKAAGGAMTTLAVLGVIWCVLGGVVGFNHMSIRPACLEAERAWGERKAVAVPLTLEEQAHEKEFLAGCNTIIQRYKETPQ